MSQRQTLMATKLHGTMRFMSTGKAEERFTEGYHVLGDDPNQWI